MTKEEKLKYCRFYKEGENCPYPFYPESEEKNYKYWFWDMEEEWITHEKGPHEDFYILYEHLGGKKFDGIPYQLLLTMFRSFAKPGYIEKESLPDFYKIVDKYLALRNEQD